MKRTIRLMVLLLTLLSAGAGGAHAQDKVRFAYDADGNRISAILVFEKVEDEEKISDDVKAPLAAVSDTIGGMQLSMYPNPADDKLMLSVAGTDGYGCEATLMTATGVTVERRTVSSAVTEFDMSRLAPGVYLISLVSGDERHVWKIVKR